MHCNMRTEPWRCGAVRAQCNKSVPATSLNLEHPKIGYFGYNKLLFDRLNMFLGTYKKILVL